METSWNAIIWNQFGAALDMLENSIRACPDKVWGNLHAKPQRKKKDVVGFWYLAFHTLFFTDYYLSENVKTETEFVPPAPFTLSEFEDGVLPERVYTREELLNYLGHCRKKLERFLGRWTDENAGRPCGIQYRENLTVAELFLYSMRHVQHHTAQLNLILRRSIDSAPEWVSRTKTKLGAE